MRIQYLILFLHASLLFAQTEWVESSLSIPQEVNCFSEDSSSNIYLSTASAILKSDGPGWIQICNSPPDPLVQFNITAKNTALASTRNKMYRSTDLGQNWNSTGYYGRQILSRHDTCFVNTGCNIIYSYDDGINWIYSPNFSTEIYTLIMGPLGELYVTSSDIMFDVISGIYRSTDYGQTFQYKGLFCELMPHTIAVRSDGVVYAAEFISYDMGDNWEVYFNEEEVWGDFLIDSKDHLYQTRYNEGVLIYSAQDSSWESIFNLPQNQTITASFIDSKNYFYIGTDSGRVFRSKEPSPTTVSTRLPEMPSNFYLNQNYPNPFNLETKIKYRLPIANHVHLSIFNTRGQIVRTLVDGRQGPGDHSMLFNSTDLASGVYIYQLKTNTFIENRKMVLLR